MEEALIIHIADVPGAQPSVLCQGLGGVLRILVVAHHDRRALHLDLVVHDAHFAALHNMAHGGNLVRTGPVRRGDLGGALGHAVALGDGDAQIQEILCQIRGQIAAAADDAAQPAAEHRLLDLLHGPVRILPGHDGDAAVEGLGDHGHAPEHGGGKEEQVLRQLGKILIQTNRVAIAKGQENVTVDAEHVVDGKNI